MGKLVKGRGPVVKLDRQRKGLMIQAILADFMQRPIQGLRTLDIGCGNGEISELFAKHNDHYAVDVMDQRRNKAGKYSFSVVNSERLPFRDGYFDIVVSHHVIEHVDNQGLHLDEVRRVTKPSGIDYIATPNRSSPIMGGHQGNDKVLRYREMLPLFRAHGFECHEYAIPVIRQPGRFYGEVRYGRAMPVLILKLLRPFFPSHMFVLQPIEKTIDKVARESRPAEVERDLGFF